MTKNLQAEVAIIGAGIVGCAAAYNLAQHGVDVLLIEKRGVGSSATGRSGGGVRQSARASEEIPLAMEAVQLFPGLSDELGVDIEYTQNGNLRLVEIPDHRRSMQIDIERQRKMGLDLRWLEAEDVRQLAPALQKGGVFGASYCPTDGHCNPFRLVTGFYEAALRGGVRTLFGHEVRNVGQDDAGNAVLIVGEQTVRAPLVIIAAGSGSNPLTLQLGFDLPLRNVRFESMVTEPISPLFSQMFGVATGDLFFRQTRHGGVHFGGGVAEEINSEVTTAKNLRLAVEHITRLIPDLRGVSLLRTWAGVEAVTPDIIPIIDKLNENYLLAAGFCGHGLAIGPIVGRYLSQWIIENERPSSLTPFRHDRFQSWLRTRWTPSGTIEHALVADTQEIGDGAGYGVQGVNKIAEEYDGESLLRIDPQACTGCRMCEMACAIHFGDGIRQTELPIQVVYPSDDFFIPIMCIHCEEVYCLEACPYEALEFDENGIVRVIDDNCILCMLCIPACPTGGITLALDKDSVTKCDLCNGRPFCAAYCPTGAITFGPLDEPTRDKMTEEIIQFLPIRIDRE
ncbi:MAG: FAD-dependent oxidoreductase [Chloroflexi bacterium]|nr:FAD-dependent oxidoreductase [Chloroflexota bacterium]